MYRKSIDVLIITFNQDQFINECVTSTFNQNTKGKVKVHVYDDASIDQTFDRLKKLIPSSINISLKINQNTRNLGVSANFHQAIKQTESEYIAILEGDDYWVDPRKLEMQIKAMEQNPEASFCFTDVLVEKDGSREDIHPNLEGKTRMFNAIDLADQTGSIAQTCTLLIRSKFLQDLPDWVLNSYTLDWCLQIFLANQGPAIYIPQVTAVYRIHDHGIWSKLSPYEGWRKNLKFYEDIIIGFRKKEDKVRINNRIIETMYKALDLALIELNQKEITFWLNKKLKKILFYDLEQTVHALRIIILNKKLLK